MRKPRRLRGYTLVALLIGLTLMTIMIAAILPLASTQRQREDEEELIFRGTQYAEAIRIFRRKYGRYPTALKEMLETKPRTIRKLWKDPILRSDDWGLVTLSQGGAVDYPDPGARERGNGWRRQNAHTRAEPHAGPLPEHG
ncbi:MAG: type II secretion system protein [Acidobacteria bacterium]|nr:type II secretion system protein [Acidobacteriota bacterium]